MPWEVTVSDPDGDDPAALAASVEVAVDFLHYSGADFHSHPSVRVTGRLSGALRVDDLHAPDEPLERREDPSQEDRVREQRDRETEHDERGLGDRDRCADRHGRDDQEHGDERQEARIHREDAPEEPAHGHARR